MTITTCIFDLPMELFVMIFEYVIDPDCMRFPYYLLMIYPRIRNLLTKNIFRSVTRVSQNQLYVNPFFNFLQNITRSHASYAHWDNGNITSVCNFVKRKLHPSVISHQLRNVRVIYTGQLEREANQKKKKRKNYNNTT